MRLTEIQMMAWVDANTLECTAAIDTESDDQWCEACCKSVWFCPLEEFRGYLDAWWMAVDLPKMERITGLSATNYPADDGERAFIEACDDWWKALDYERQRAIWTENDQRRIVSEDAEKCYE